ncbi:hypothetical protein NKG94_00660 [Micromonospora sp. M12]
MLESQRESVPRNDGGELDTALHGPHAADTSLACSPVAPRTGCGLLQILTSVIATVQRTANVRARFAEVLVLLAVQLVEDRFLDINSVTLFYVNIVEHQRTNSNITRLPSEMPTLYAPHRRPSVSKGIPMRDGKRRSALLGSALTLVLSAAVLSAVPVPASAATTWTVNGPSTASPVTAQVVLNDNGTLSFAVSHQGRTVLSPSAIGIETGAADLTRNLTFTGRADRTVTEAYDDDRQAAQPVDCLCRDDAVVRRRWRSETGRRGSRVELRCRLPVRAARQRIGHGPP